MTLKETLDILLLTHEGKVLSFNLLHAVKFGILPSEKATEFLGEWLQPYLSGEDEKLSPDALKETFYTTLAAGERNSKTYLSATQIARSTSNLEHNYFFSVMDYEIFYFHKVHGDSLENGEILPDPRDFNFDASFKAWKESKEFDKQYKLAPGDRIANHLGLYWICPEKDLRKFISLQYADRLRDYLGLSHYGEKTYLVAVKIEPNYLENSEGDNIALRPTPLDAGFHPHFKSLADITFEDDYNNESGHTFDIRKQKNNISDGGREFIVKEKLANRIVNYKLIPLYKTTRSANNTVKSNKAFIKKLEKTGGFNEEILFDELKKLFYA